MNYLIFNNEIVISDGSDTRRIGKADLDVVDLARLCVVDVDVLIAASVEFPVEKKDNILVRKFKELYQHENYIIQDERIDNNLFQVIGIKEQKVRDIYSLVSLDKVELLIPYGIALRNLLINKIGDLSETIVFVDDFGNERLITVFDGLKFSRTRVIVNDGENILPEIKRSQIDFLKKTEEFLNKKNSDFVVIVNNQELAEEIRKNNEKLQVNFLNVICPAVEGLKVADNAINYRLPEENLRQRKEIELKKKAIALIVSFFLVAIGFSYFILSRLKLEQVNDQFKLAKQINERLDKQLSAIDKEVYRADLRCRKSVNYGISYLEVLNLIPPSYTVNSFKIYKTNKWNIEMTLLINDRVIVDSIPRIRILRNSEIKDIYVNNQPGKSLRIII